MLPLLVPILSALAPVVAETAAAQIFGDDSPVAGKVADAVVSVASQVTGLPMQSTQDAQQAAQMIAADPAVLVEFQKRVNEATATVLSEETRRLQTINETMRAEIASSDPYVRRMRPTFGYVMAAAWAAQMGSISYTIVTAPQEAGRILSALADTTALWTVGLTVLGVYIYRRSGEKTGTAGGLPAVLANLPLPGRKPAPPL
ncbi:3TM-type holin [Azospirillum sp. ST 5-10]|uniref:3TM-type holin n=1 Tax=unclassified Azospirillum TaxID=2630922 RepID=UPI003F4A6262